LLEDFYQLSDTAVNIAIGIHSDNRILHIFNLLLS